MTEQHDEPVAWLHHCKGMPDLLALKPLTRGAGELGWTETPLYTRPTPPADSAMVEALMLSAHLKRLADAYTCDPSRYYRAELLGKFVAENLPAIYSALKAAEQTKPRAATTPVRAAPAVGIAGNTAMADALSANAAKLAERDREIEALRGDVGRRDILIAEMIGKAAISVSLGGGEMWSRFNDEAIQGRAALGSAEG